MIYGKYGFPVLGIEGIGYTGSIVGWFMFGCLLWYCQSTAVLKQNFSTWTLKVNLTEMKNLLFTGSFSGITTVLDPITFFIASIMFGYFGVISLASYQIVMQCLSIAYNLPLAVSIITGLKVSHSLGANYWVQLKRDIHVAFYIGVVISLGFTSLFLLKPKMIIELFLPDNIHAISLYQATSLSLLAGSVILFFDAAQSYFSWRFARSERHFYAHDRKFLLLFIDWSRLFLSISFSHLFEFFRNLDRTYLSHDKFITIFSAALS